MSHHSLFLIRELTSNIEVFRNLLTNVSQEQALWKQSSDTWSLTEVICHLIDEEILDFRTRVKTALAPHKYPFIPIDPISWVKAHNYINQDYQTQITKWISEREKSINWLESLENPNWDSCLIHSALGEMSAGQFLSNWVAHDHIHIRQINRTKRAYLDYLSDQDLNYAGKW